MATQGADRLAELVAACLDAIEVEGDTAVDRVCRENPDLADELRHHVASLRRFGMLGTMSGRSGAADGDPGAMPERLGEFRLLARLGGGGMGVVYLAEQTSLGREVALKLVRPEHLFFPGSRERFLREVAIIAKLQHPGIVPIYTVGEENGVPYYAMERVAGCTLAEAIQKLSSRRPEALEGADLHVQGASYVDACVRVVARVAEALSHAHQRGVIHRDVKPSNVMVTPEGRVMLLDFGLASSEEASRITRSGSQPGSLAYMAPEQVRGDARAIDARTDVYQLGVTLFELLSLRLPYAAENAEETRGLILDGSPPPLRALNRRVPWDVETVCLTAMEREPSRRYATTAAFHADLENLLARRPIAARRPGPLLRARRFAQRRPAVTVGGVLGFLIVVGGPLAYAKFERDARKDLQEEQGRTEAQRKVAVAQEARAKAHFRRVLHAVAQLLEPLLDERTDEFPEMVTLRGDVLGRALGVYEGFGPEDAADPELRRDLAAASATRAKIQLLLDRKDRASVDLQRSIDELSAIAESSPGDSATLKALGESLMQLASMRGLADSEAVYRRAIAALEQIPSGDPVEPAARRLIADTRIGLGNDLNHQGRREEGEAEIRAGLGIAEALLAADPDDLVAIELKAAALFRIGEPLALAAGSRRHAEGMEALETSRRLYGELVGRHGGSRTMRYHLGQVLFRISRGHDIAKDRTKGAAVMAEAYGIMSELHARFPEIENYATELGETAGALGYFRLDEGKLDEAHALITRSLELIRASCERDPSDVTPRVSRAVNASYLGKVEVRRGRGPEAVAAYAEALELAKVPMPQPTPGWVANSLREWRWERVDALILAGELDDAAEALDELVGAELQGCETRARTVSLLARCAIRAESLDDLPEDERVRLAEAFEEDAIARLEDAMGRGFKPTRGWLSEPALQRLKRRDDFHPRLVALGVEIPEPAAAKDASQQP